MIQIENKYEKGTKLYVISRRAEQKNILEIKPVFVVGLGYQDQPGQSNTLFYFFKFSLVDEKEPMKMIPENELHVTAESAANALIEAASQLRDVYDQEIAEAKKKVQDLQKEKDRIQRVIPNEPLHVPETLKPLSPTI